MHDRQERWRMTFRFYDVNNDGVIGQEDLAITIKNLLERKRVTPDSAQGKAIIEGTGKVIAALAPADADRDGEITLEEWNTFFDGQTNRHDTGTRLPSPLMLEFARAAFPAFDVDGDGAVDASDYAACAEIHHTGCGAPALDVHWQVLTGRHGSQAKLNFDEFLAAFIEIWCSEASVPFWFPHME